MSAPQSQELPPTTLVAGKYRLTKLLGRGGMGSVWEGVHASLGNRVACKFIEPRYIESSDAVTRFENEARAAASLHSKHVVDIYDHGVLEDGRPYIVMEYLSGESLDVRLEKCASLPLQEVASIVRQVSLALAKAHSNGIIHRDLKPDNIFLVWDEEDQRDVVKVVDFGIAKFTRPTENGISSATKTGSILGTPYYMSPEQARGLKSIDARSDNWSLGVIAYQALTGRLPFDSEALGDLLVKLCTMDPTPPSEFVPTLPPAVDEWLSQALNRDPELRFQDAREMAEALLSIAKLPQRDTLGSTGSGTKEALVPTAAEQLPPARTHPLGSAKTTNAPLSRPNASATAPTNNDRTKITLIWLSASLGIAVLAVIWWLGSAAHNETSNRGLPAESPLSIEEIVDNPVVSTVPDKPSDSPLPTAVAPDDGSAPKSTKGSTQKSSELPPPAPKPRSTPARTTSPALNSVPVPKAASPPKPAAKSEPIPSAAPIPEPELVEVDLGY